MLGWTWLPAGMDFWQFMLLGTCSTLLIGMAKAGFGGSIGLLATPIMIAATGGDSLFAISILLPLLIACDQVSILKWWRRWSWPVVWLLLPGAAMGVAAGGVALWRLGRLERAGAKDTADAVLGLAIGAIALSFVIIQAWRMVRRKPMDFRPVLWQGTSFGLAAGFTSTLAHGAGPITAMYLLPQGLKKETYVASTVLYYWIGNLMKLPVYAGLGRLDAQAFRSALLLLPAVVVGTFTGVYLNRKVGQKQFNAVVYVLLALAGAGLVYGAVRELLP